jgi:hypothetical protein
MATIAAMTVSDGRSYVHQEILTFGLAVQERIVRAQPGAGRRVVTAAGDIHSNASAVAVARELAGARPDLTIGPNIRTQALDQLPAPTRLLCRAIRLPRQTRNTAPL